MTALHSCILLMQLLFSASAVMGCLQAIVTGMMLCLRVTMTAYNSHNAG
jgi:hypothetical protein